MRSNNMLLFTAAAIVAITCNQTYAQSGARSFAPSTSVLQNAPVVSGQSFQQAGEFLQAQAPQFGSQVVSGGQVFSSGEVFSQGVPANNVYESAIAPTSGCTSCGGGGGGNVVPYFGDPYGGYDPGLAPTTSCNTPLGKLGIPPLWLPTRSYTPPIGKQVGRPLIGRWSGF